jgi:hypothetical protein
MLKVFLVAKIIFLQVIFQMYHRAVKLHLRHSRGKQRELLRDAWNRFWVIEMSFCLRCCKLMIIFTVHCFRPCFKAKQNPKIFQPMVEKRMMFSKYLLWTCFSRQDYPFSFASIFVENCIISGIVNIRLTLVIKEIVFRHILRLGHE